MKADSKKSSAVRNPLDQAAQAQFRRELAAFKQFVYSSIEKMERGQASLIIVNVVKDPCKKGLTMMSRQIKGPPDTSA